MTQELRERVAEAMWMADVEPYDPSNRIPFKEAPESAQTYVYAEADAAIALVLEEAAKVAEDCAPASQDTFSTELAERCDMVAAAIRALKEKSDEQ